MIWSWPTYSWSRPFTEKAREIEWTDYELRKRRAIDRSLKGVDGPTAENVRKTILSFERVPSTQKFCDFALNHVSPLYFRDEAAGIDNPVGRANLYPALRQAYIMRSKYMHRLAELPTLLKLDAYEGETIQIDRTPHFTFRGIIRLARHVILEFIRRQPKVETEVYEYSLERVGVVQISPAPQYWVGNTVGLHARSGRKYLEGFLEQIAAHLQQDADADAAVTDLKDVLAWVERELPAMDSKWRLPFLVLYVLFNNLVAPNSRAGKFKAIATQYEPEFTRPSAESMVLHLVLNQIPDWPIAQHQDVHDKYFEKRNEKGGIMLPRIFEAGFSLVMAERHRKAGDVTRARELISFAVETCPGHAGLSDYERGFDPNASIDWKDVLLLAQR